MKQRPEPELTQWPIEKLKQHPRQNIHFGLRSKQELQALADLIKRNGMDCIDITPSGVILSGHQRRYVAQYLLKWETVPVRVRHDLAFDGPAAEEQYFIDSNAANRQLSRLQQVRNFERDVELETQRRKQAKAQGQEVETGRVREHVAKLYQLSARTLADWVPLLQLPKGVQDAIEDKRLTRALAMQILAEPEEVRKKIAAELADHKTTRKVLKRYLTPAKTKPLTGTQLARLWRDLIRYGWQLDRSRPNSLQALLPQHGDGLAMLSKLTELAKHQIAPQPILKLKLVRKPASKAPKSTAAMEKPKLVLVPKQRLAK